MSVTIKIKRGTTVPTTSDLVSGELAINTTDGNLYTKFDDGTVANVVSDTKKLTATVRNETGTELSAFKAVYISGASGNKPLVTLAQANSEATSSKTFGVTTSSISNNNNGTVICSGTLQGVDTNAYAAGTTLWLSESSAGGFATTAPTAPNHAVFIGVVTRQHQTQGSVEIRIQNGYEIQELHNVNISSVANNDLFAYESSSSLWKNKTISSLGIATLASPTFTGTVTIPAGASISGFATLASPTFTGTPLAPTATAGTNTTQLATTAFVNTAISTKANIASPSFTGTPSAPTATTSTNSTQIATTAYVKNNLASYATTSYITSTLASYTQTASLNSNLIPTTVLNLYDATIYSNVSHINAIITFNTEGATSHDYYIMAENSVSMPLGTQIVLVQNDAYSATIHGDTGVTLYSRGSRFTMNGQYSVATLIKVAYDTWVLSGDLV